MSVVLPAPFGPSRPVTPGPNEQLSSDRATFCPNHTETVSTSTVASATKAGSTGARSTRRPPAVGGAGGGGRADALPEGGGGGGGNELPLLPLTLIALPRCSGGGG